MRDPYVDLGALIAEETSHTGPRLGARRDVKWVRPVGGQCGEPGAGADETRIPGAMPRGEVT